MDVRERMKDKQMTVKEFSARHGYRNNSVADVARYGWPFICGPRSEEIATSISKFLGDKTLEETFGAKP